MLFQKILCSSNPKWPKKLVPHPITWLEDGGRGGIWTPGFNDANVAIFQADLPAHWHFKPYKNVIKRYGKINLVFLSLNRYVFDTKINWNLNKRKTS